ncbi:MAG: SMI1/KNR4 family protein [Pirellulaceae bacterium]|jgi:hypothetical protein|nr:SMI1/KNR4 family protein [Pirellulaceae bacterium]MDP7016514.1 SMI1/KNR4 family protein [Pirellulaceae bacterium]
MAKPWSDQIAAMYDLRMPADLAAWLDDEVWREAAGAEFCMARTPSQLLVPEPGVVWGGFMLPDTLPIISNQYGDWLCLRAASDGQIREIIYWCHRGGDWIPYGRSLSEALLYDAAFRLNYDRRAEWGGVQEDDRNGLFRAAEWALTAIDPRRQPARFWQSDHATDGPLAALRAAGVADTAVSRDLILHALESELKVRGTAHVASEMGLQWEPDFVSWVFDGALIPELTREELSRQLQTPVDQLTVQDWDRAEVLALEVIASRDDMGWAFDVAGWAAERRGDFAAALDLYWRGLHCSAFSDDTVRFRTHWFPAEFGKFAAARMHVLRDHLPTDWAEDAYLQLFWAGDAESLHERVKQYWCGVADDQMDVGMHAAAYQSYYRAGWDIGLRVVTDYSEILEQMAAAAAAAHYSALERIARLHARFL